MFDDAAISTSIGAALRNIPVPALPFNAIVNKMHAPAPPSAPRRVGYVRGAVAAAAVLGILAGAYPAKSIAVIQSLEARYRAALQALGGTAPPPAPHALVKSLQAQRVTLAQARSGVSFTLVAPAGLPGASASCGSGG